MEEGEEGGGAGGRCQTRAGRWGLMNPEKEELKPGEVAKRPAVIITAPLGSLSIRVAVGASDSCGRWRRSREREGGVLGGGVLGGRSLQVPSLLFLSSVIRRFSHGADSLTSSIQT